MTLDIDHYKATTKQHWEEHASGWNDWAPLFETWLGETTHHMLDLADRNSVWDEIQTEMSRFDTADGFVEPCELVIAGGVR